MSRLLNYYYKLKDAEVTVKYVDKDTNEELKPSIKLTKGENDHYIVEVPDFENYKYLESSGKLVGTFSTEEKTIILYYRHNAKVIVN